MSYQSHSSSSNGVTRRLTRSEEEEKADSKGLEMNVPLAELPAVNIDESNVEPVKLQDEYVPKVRRRKWWNPFGWLCPGRKRKVKRSKPGVEPVGPEKPESNYEVQWIEFTVDRQVVLVPKFVRKSPSQPAPVSTAEVGVEATPHTGTRQNLVKVEAEVHAITRCDKDDVDDTTGDLEDATVNLQTVSPPSTTEVGVESTSHTGTRQNLVTVEVEVHAVTRYRNIYGPGDEDDDDTTEDLEDVTVNLQTASPVSAPEVRVESTPDTETRQNLVTVEVEVHAVTRYRNIYGPGDEDDDDTTGDLQDATVNLQTALPSSAPEVRVESTPHTRTRQNLVKVEVEVHAVTRYRNIYGPGDEDDDDTTRDLDDTTVNLQTASPASLAEVGVESTPHTGTSQNLVKVEEELYTVTRSRNIYGPGDVDDDNTTGDLEDVTVNLQTTSPTLSCAEDGGGEKMMQKTVEGGDTISHHREVSLNTNGTQSNAVTEAVALALPVTVAIAIVVSVAVVIALVVGYLPLS